MNRLLSALWARLNSAAPSTGSAAAARSATQAPAQRRRLVSTPPSLLRLEARLVFDGAAVDTALHVVDATAAPADAAARTTEPVVNGVAPVLVTDAARAVQAQAGKDMMTAAGAAAVEPGVPGAHKEVAFIDTRVSGYQSLVDAVRPGVEVVLIDSSRDGLAQMADWATTHTGYDAIHVLSHGAEGTLYLGRGALNSAALGDAQVLAELQQLGQALKADGDLLLYGCSVASGATGQAFLAQLAQVTGADVAASTDTTGSADVGGDWILEGQSGRLEVAALQPTGWDGSLVLPVSGTTSFEVTNYYSSTGADNGSGYTISNLGSTGWDFTGYGGDNSNDIDINIESDYLASPSKFAYAASDHGSTHITGIQLAPNTSKLFDLSSLDVLMDDAASVARSLTLTGYLNGTAVSGATLTLSVGSLSGQSSRTHFDVSGNSNFLGIDAFRVTSGVNTIGLLGVDNVVATNFHDPGPATVTGVTSSKTNGAYKAGDVITVQVSFSAAVTVNTAGGTPTLTLETGSVDRVISYAGGSGSTTLNFSYTVQAGDTSADLDYLSTAALALNGGTIRDGSAQDATLTLATPGAANSLGANKALVIDTTAPSAPSAPDLASASDSGSSNTDDQTSATTPTFSGTAEANATVRLYDTDGTTQIGSATANGAGSWTITSSTLGAGSHTVTAKTVDAAGNVSAASSGLSVTIDTTAPTVSSVAVPANASYGTGQNLDFTVNFAEAVTVDTTGGTPRIALTLDTGGTVYASYLSGSGTSALVFRYTVASGNVDSNGITVGALGANGGTLRDAAGNNATLTLNSVGSTSGVLVDTVAPVFSSATTNTIGSTITLNYGETLGAATLSAGDFAVTAGGQAVGVASVAISGSTVVLTLSAGVRTGQAVTVAYTDPTAGDDANAVQDAAGNDALTLAATSVTNNTRASVTFDNAYQLFDNGATNGFAANTTGPDIDPNVANVGVNGVYITNLRFIASAASTSASGAFQLQGNDVTGTLEFTGTLTDSALTPHTTTFSLLGAISKHIKTRNGNSGDSEAFYFWTAGNGSPWDGLGVLMITKGSESWFLDNETNISMPADNAYLTTLNTYQSVLSDSTAPTLSSIAMSDTALKAGETATVTFTFSEAVSGFTNADLTIANGTLTSVSSADGGLTWTATFTPTASVEDATNVITLNMAGVTDAAGNAGSGSSSSGNYAIDTQRPTATITMADTALKIGDTSLVTFTFSEAVSSFTNADLTIANGALTSVTTADGGLTWTGTFTPTASLEDATNVITLDQTGVVDAAGNAGTGTVSTANYTVDTVRPTATITMADTALKIGDTSLVTFTFSEAVSGFTNADLTIANGTLTSVTTADGGLTWTGTFTPTASLEDATNVITLDQTGVVDAAGNAGTGTVSTANYTIDTVRPTATITMADTALKLGDTSLVTFTFSEAVSGFTNADLTIANGTLTSVTTADGGLTWTGTFTPTASLEDATNVITLDQTGVVDAAGNAGTGTVSTANYTVDTVRPTATITMADTALKLGDTSLVTFTFSEAVSGFTNADLTIANGTLTSVTTADGGLTWTGTFAPTASLEDATNVITLDQTGVVDAAGNAGTGTVSAVNYTVDTVRPTATITMADTALKLGDTSLVTFTFSEAVSGFTNADLTIANGTLTSVTTADGGLTWTGTFTPTASLEDATNAITLDQTGVVDAAGNAGTGTVSTANYAIDTLAPSSLASSVATLMSTDTGPGVVLGTLSATESSALSWALASGNGSNDADNALFQIVGNQLRSAGTLPGGELHLLLSATDAAGNVSTQAFTLTVIANAGGPALTTPTPVTVQDTEDADRFSPFTGSLLATDADGIAAYGLQGAASGSFSVDGQTYDRSLAGSHGTLYLDSTGGRYAYVADEAMVNALTANASDSFIVTATDGHAGAPMSSSTTLTVNIAAANDRPALATPATVLYIDTPADDRFDTASTTLLGSDRDSGAELAYGISGGSVAGTTVQRVGQYGTLRVDRASGALVFTPDATALNALTADATETFTLTVSDGQLSGSAAYTVQIRAANDLPTLAAVPGIDYTDTVASDHFAPSDGALVAADRDAATVLSHGVQGGAVSDGISRMAGRYGMLEIDTATGAYRYTPDDAAVNALDADATDTFTLTVSDGTASASTLLTVSLAGANDRPVIGSGSSASVLENASAGTVVYRATASDVDAGQTLRFRLAGADAALFDIDAVTGEVRLKASADFEARASYSFEVQAYDDGTGALSASQAVSLQVLDVNEAPRITSAAEAHVAENGAAHAAVTTVTASDPDAGQQQRFSLAGEDAALFDIDAQTGVLTLKAPADHEARASYRLLVTATDNGQPALSDTQALTVWVDDVNEAPVLDAVAPITVAEDLAVGSVVCSARASDVDAGQTLSYALTGPDAARLHIDPRTGVVTLAQALDFETQQTLSFAIVVSDGGQPALQAVRQVTLTVTDVVEQLPPAPAPVPVELRPEPPAPAPAPAPLPAPAPVPPDDAAGRAVAAPPVTRSITAGYGVPVQTLSDGMAGNGLSVVRDIPLQRAAVSNGVITVNFTIPTDTFSHTDPQASVSLQVSMADGRPLPAWLRFDPATGSFAGQPPAGFNGPLDIRVVARDDQGRQVETQVRIQVERPAAGQRQSDAGRPGLSGQWRGQGVFAWKLERDKLLQQARAVQAQRQVLGERAAAAPVEAKPRELRRG